MVDHSPTNMDREGSVQDAVLAHDLIRSQQRGGESVKALIRRLWRTLNARNPRWSHRRVRALASMEAARVDAWEMRDLEALARAKEAHDQQFDRLARLEAMVADLVAAQRRDPRRDDVAPVRGMDRARAARLNPNP